MLEDKLKKPFPVEKLSWRVGQKNKDKTKANMLVYIDARDVMDRLDEVCGQDGWSDQYENIGGRMVCTISIKTENGWVSKTDGAGDTDIEGEKGGLSDAFKRAAVKWGIGRYLYNAANYITWVSCKDMPDYDIYKNNKEQLDKVAEAISKTVSPTLQKRVEGFKQYIAKSDKETLTSKNVEDRYYKLLDEVDYKTGFELVKIYEDRLIELSGEK